jgi:hypothetical protein
MVMGIAPSEDAGGLVGRVAQGLLPEVDEGSGIGDLGRGQICPAPHGVFARAPALIVEQYDMKLGMEGAGWLLGGLHAEEISYGLVLLLGAEVLEAHLTHGRRRRHRGRRRSRSGRRGCKRTQCVVQRGIGDPSGRVEVK